MANPHCPSPEECVVSQDMIATTTILRHARAAMAYVQAQCKLSDRAREKLAASISEIDILLGDE